MHNERIQYIRVFCMFYFAFAAAMKKTCFAYADFAKKS